MSEATPEAVSKVMSIERVRRIEAVLEAAPQIDVSEAFMKLDALIEADRNGAGLPEGVTTQDILRMMGSQMRLNRQRANKLHQLGDLVREAFKVSISQ